MRECCEKPENLKETERHKTARADIVVRVCQACGARHHEMSVKPVTLTFTGKPG